VTTDLSYFDLIVPCGIADKSVTSLARELGREVEMSEVEERCAARFANVFDRELVESPAGWQDAAQAFRPASP
jgi:lipoyl(octanoyl) transferase